MRGLVWQAVTAVLACKIAEGVAHKHLGRVPVVVEEGSRHPAEGLHAQDEGENSKHVNVILELGFDRTEVRAAKIECDSQQKLGFGGARG